MLPKTSSQIKWGVYLHTRWQCLSSTVRYTKIKAPSWPMKIPEVWKVTNSSQRMVQISNREHKYSAQTNSKMTTLQNTIRSECSTNSNRNKFSNYRDKTISSLNKTRIWSSDFLCMNQWFNRCLRRLKTCRALYQKRGATCWNKNLRSLICSISSTTSNSLTIMKPYRTR